MMSHSTILNFAREALGLDESVSLKLSPLAGRGSDRSYARVTWREHSAILVRYDPGRLENTYFAAIAEFLREINIPVPRLIRHDPGKRLILMQDLGDKDLWSCRGVGSEKRRDFYEKTLAIVHRLHSFPEKNFPLNRVKLMEPFGPDLYRWERNYFREHFLKDFCRITLEDAFEIILEEELSALAARLSQTRRSLVHRDLQSQNVMIREGELFLIDFQGMRWGSPFYDLGSLLCDPYMDLDDGERDQLLSYYYGLSVQPLEWQTFRDYFWEASVQRLMQALGAFGFLGLKKGLAPFLEHIPSGFHNLRNAAEHVTSLPRLRELLGMCRV